MPFLLESLGYLNKTKVLYCDSVLFVETLK